MAVLAVPLLADRLGEDSVHKLEAAAARRFAEAEHLRASGFTVGAVYLYGYVAEARLEAAYFADVKHYGPNTPITRQDRRMAIAEASQKGVMDTAPHNILGWARFLTVTRHPGFSRQVETDLIGHAQALYACWRPALRYRVTVPTPGEVNSVHTAATWFEAHYPEIRR